MEYGSYGCSKLVKRERWCKILLIVIDTLSKYLRVIALRQKSAKNVTNALKEVFESGVKCQTLRSDRGGEFKNRILQNYLKTVGVRLIFANQNSKASIAERGFRTIRARLYRYFKKIEHINMYIFWLKLLETTILHHTGV